MGSVLKRLSAVPSEDNEKALEITGDNLEDLLAYDDLFLDFFNAFLALPVFPQALVYNRLTGAFEEVDGTSNGPHRNMSLGLPYGATDEERDNMLEWAKEQRLPLFLSTEIFREFKLCKLLLRPLEEHHSASHGSSQQIRGYSRQSESYVSSLSNSADNSASNALDDEDAYMDPGYSQSACYDRYQRPGSRAVSVPARMFYSESEGPPGSTTTETQQSSPLSKSASQRRRAKLSSNLQFFPNNPTDSGHGTSIQHTLDDKLSRGNTLLRDSTIVTFDPRTEEQSSASRSKRSSRFSPMKPAPPPTSDSEATFLRHARVLSAPVSYEDFHRHQFFDYDFLFGEEEPEPHGPVYVKFEDEAVSEEQTETDVKNMEGRLKISLQEVKEQVLGMASGMEAYHNFLVGTAGEHLYNFWLDCEYFKDTMEDFDEEANNEARNRLFRDIQDKYKMNLTTEAKEQIGKAASNASLSHTIFIRTQYNILRRLRAYWVPRFLMHQEMSPQTSCGPNRNEILCELVREKSMIPKINTLPFFPSISLVNSLPIRAEDILSCSCTKTWASVCQSGRSFDLRIKSAQTLISPQIRTTKERFLIALTADKLAGGPFLKYLENNNKLLLSNFLFWQDVTEYGALEDRSADRLLRLCQAWAIYNSYFSEGSLYNVGLSKLKQDMLHNTLLDARDFIEASVFDSAKYYAVDLLEKAWIRFLKEDLKHFLDCRVRQGERSPPSTAEAIKITMCNGELLIQRPRPWVKRHQRSEKEEFQELDEKTRAELKARACERKKEMERERKKAIKAAYRRVREAKMNKPDSAEKEDGRDYADFDVKSSGKPSPPFPEMTSNKQVMTSFRKHLQDGEDKERFHMLQLYMDIESYHALGTNKKGKGTQANMLSKTYLEHSAKKHVTFNEKIKTKLSSDKERPKSSTIQEIQSYILPTIEECFSAYIVAKAKEYGMDARSLVSLSQAELSTRMGSEGPMLGSLKKKSKGKEEVSTINEGSIVRQLTYPAITVAVLENEEKPRRTLKDQTLKRVRKVRFLNRHASNYLLDTRMIDISNGQTDDHLGQDSHDRLHSGQAQHFKKFRGIGSKQTGRAQPTKEDREQFFKALKASAAGHLSLQMLHFYKYLVKHGHEDGVPVIDKSLFFYIESQKFKDCSHAFSDEELLRKKVQSVIDCFLESVTGPALQVDLPAELHQRTLRQAQKYLHVTGREALTNIFDEAQTVVFKELLPYWSGFKKVYSPPNDQNNMPVTKYQKMLKKRLESINNYKMPPRVFSLPSIPGGGVSAYTFTLSEGVKWREMASEGNGSALGERLASRATRMNMGVEILRRRRMSHVSVTSSGDCSSRRSSIIMRS